MRYNSFEQAEESRFGIETQKRHPWQQIFPLAIGWFGVNLVPSAFVAPAAVVFDRELLAYSVGLVVLVLVGIGVAIKVRSRARQNDPLPRHSLAYYQDLLDKGLLDPQEFQRIAELLNRQPPTPPIT